MSLEALRSGDWLTRERILRVGIVLLVVFAAATAWDFRSHTSHGTLNSEGEHLGRDFVNYWAGARLAADGRLSKAYDIRFFHDYQRSLVGDNAEFKIYSYPPVTALLTLPLALLDFVPAFFAWLALGIGLCALLLAQTLSRPVALLSATASPAVFINALSGQNGQYSAALLAAGVIFLEERPVLSGVFFGLLAYKPHLGMLLPFALAAGGHWRTIASASATVLTLVGASVALFGQDAWLNYFQEAKLQAVLLEQGFTFWHRMPTVFAAMRVAGAGVAVAHAEHAVCAGLALAAVIMIWRTNCPTSVKGASLMVGTMLLTPYGWDYDLVALTFAVAWIARDGTKTGFMPWEKIVLALLIVLPLAMGGLTKAIGIQVGPLVLWLALLFIVRRAMAGQPTLQSQSPLVSVSGSAVSR